MTPAARFTALQQRLAHRPPAARRTVVAFPSLSLGTAYEETRDTPALETRWLYLLLHLRDPARRVVVATSRPVPERHVDAYLDLVPDVRDARDRLVLVHTDDPSHRPLAAKLLDDPAALARLRTAIGDPADAYLQPFNVTDAERDVALALDVPILGVDPRFAAYGTKTGGRRAFAAAGVAAPFGTEGVGDETALATALGTLRADRPDLAAVVVKLDDSWLGAGNAIVRLPPPGDDLLAAVRDQLTPGYRAALAAEPWVVEELLEGAERHSPSVQVLLPADGPPVVLGTHDQILGGPLGHTFRGGRFPADPRYGPVIVRSATRLAEHLAAAGVTGRLAVDYVVVRGAGGAWDAYALEINLREGATTHPQATLALLTGGAFDAASGTFRAADGSPRHYVFSDGLRTDPGPAVATARFRAALAAAGLAFDPRTGEGVVPHMLTALERDGRPGATAIATTAEEAERRYEATRSLLHGLAAGSLS